MKAIPALLVILMLMITAQENHDGKMLQYSSNSGVHKDKTETQMKALFDMLQSFAKHNIEKAHVEWKQQNPTSIELPSEIISFKNITLTKFISDEDILSVWNLKKISCNFQEKILKSTFTQARNYTNLEGNIKFLHKRNTGILTLRISFDFYIDTVTYILKISSSTNNTNKHEEITDFKEIRIENLKLMTSKGTYQQPDADKEQILKDTSKAIWDMIRKRFQLVAKSIIRSISNKCLHPAFEKNEKNYAHFKLYYNMETFPWMDNYNELIIKGLDNFERLSAFYGKEKTIIEMNTFEIQLNWHHISLEKSQFDYIASEFKIKTAIKMPKAPKDYFNWLMGMVMENDYFSITLGPISSLPTHNETPDDGTLVTTLLWHGIIQEFQKIQYVDGIAGFTNTIREILRSLENLFVDSGKIESSTTSFSNIEMKAYHHFENISCSSLDNIGVGTIIYENIKVQVEFIHSVESSGGYITGVQKRSAKMYIKRANINISQHRYLNSITIHDDFDESDMTITFDTLISPRNNRITFARGILRDFIKLMKDRINNTVVNSMLRPILDACQYPSRSVTEPSSNYLNHRRFSAYINGKRFNQSVDIVVNGTWNFNYIKADYANGNMIDLRMENVTGSMTLMSLSYAWLTLSYRTSYFALIIDHTHTNIKVKVPEGLDFLDITPGPDPSSHFHLNKAQITTLFESTVASFIELSVYSDWNDSRETAWKLVNKTMNKAALNDMSSTCDATSIFVNNFVEILKNISEFESSLEDRTHGIKVEHSASNNTFHCTFSPFSCKFSGEEICDIFNNSSNKQNSTEQFNIYGTINVEVDIENKTKFASELSFISNKYRVLDTSNTEYNETLEIIKDPDFTDVMSNFEPYTQDLLEESFTDVANTVVAYLRLIPSWPNICIQKCISEKPPMEDHFYWITNTINIAPQSLLIYHIKLYGLYNLESLRLTHPEASRNGVAFKLTTRNLTANVIWSYYIENSFLRMPKEMNLQIDKISLTGTISPYYKALRFTDDSDVQFSTILGSGEMFLLNNNLKLAIIDSMQQLITESYQNTPEQKRNLIRYGN